MDREPFLIETKIGLIQIYGVRMPENGKEYINRKTGESKSVNPVRASEPVKPEEDLASVIAQFLIEDD